MNTSPSILFGATQAMYTSPHLAAIALAQAPTDQLGADLDCVSDSFALVCPSNALHFKYCLDRYKECLREGDALGAHRSQLELARTVLDILETKWIKIIRKVEETGWATTGGFFATPHLPAILQETVWSCPQSTRNHLWEMGREKSADFEKTFQAVYSVGLLRLLERAKPREETAFLYFTLLYYQPYPSSDLTKWITDTLFNYLVSHPKSISPTFNFLKGVMHIARRTRDPLFRLYILTLLEKLAEMVREQPDISHSLRLPIYSLCRNGLDDPLPINAFKAWNVANAVAPHLASHIDTNTAFYAEPITPADFPCLETKWVKYLRSEWPFSLAWEEMAPFLQADDGFTNEKLSITGFSPVHTLDDFHPDTKRRRPLMEWEYNRVEVIMKRILKPADPTEFFRQYFDHPYLPPLLVLQLSHGCRCLLHGHHRIAALYKAAEENIIPKEWLDQIPVRLTHYQGPWPKQLLIQSMTLGTPLDWPDLFHR